MCNVDLFIFHSLVQKSQAEWKGNAGEMHANASGLTADGDERKVPDRADPSKRTTVQDYLVMGERREKPLEGVTVQPITAASNWGAAVLRRGHVVHLTQEEGNNKVLLEHSIKELKLRLPIISN